MARAHLFRPVTDREGNLLYNATVTVREVAYSVPIGQSLFAGPTGTDELPNPFTVVNGVIDFWLDTPQRMSLLVQADGVADIQVYLDAPPPPEEIVSSPVPLEIVNEPLTSGQVLIGTGTAGQVQWGSPPAGTALTPVVVVSAQDFGGGSDPVGWLFVQTNGGSHVYDPGTLPSGTTYTQSLEMTQSANGGTVKLTGPTFTLLEAGRLSLWIKTAVSTGETFTVKVANPSAVQTTLTSVAQTQDWGFFAFDLAAGTWTPIFEYDGQSTFAAGDHSVWITGYVAQYGGNIQAHNHSGTGTNSVALGTGSTASGTASTAVGANSTATGTNASAYGYNASAAGTNALAVGYNSSAATDYSLAVGSGASGATSTDTGWVSIGYGSTANGQEAVAVGKNANVQADYGSAMGSGAQVASTGTSAVAIGQNAQANGANSVAIGQGAVVGATHNNSVALGSQAATTSANQIMLGNAGAITTVTGSLQNYGIASLGSADSRVGFYGTAGNTRQVVSGSDDGNVTLRTLVRAMASLGLISNQTVEQPVATPNPVGVIDYFYHQDPGDGSLGVADFDFAPYVYRPLAYADQSPYPSGPQWFVGADHNAYKGYAGGLGALKNMYQPRHTYQLSLSTSGTGNKICLALRHTGDSTDTAAAGYIILDQAANTVSLAHKNSGDTSATYTVASGNSVSLSTIGSLPFDGNSHTHIISVSGANVMYQDSSLGTPVFFKDTSLNLAGTYIGVDFNLTTTVFHNLLFSPPYTFDGFKTTGALSNAASGEAWWPVQSGSGAATTVSAAGNLQITGASSGYALAYVLVGPNTSGKVVSTRWATGTTPTTAMGVIGGYVDPNNYYFVNNSQIVRVLSGTATVLTTLSSSFAAGDQMYVGFYANGQIVVQKGATVIGSATDTTSSLVSSTRYGLGVRGTGTANFTYFVTFDNISTAVTYK